MFPLQMPVAPVMNTVAAALLLGAKYGASMTMVFGWMLRITSQKESTCAKMKLIASRGLGCLYAAAAAALSSACDFVTNIIFTRRVRM